MCLFSSFDDSQTVTAAIGYDGGSEADECISAEFLERFVGFWFGDVCL